MSVEEELSFEEALAELEEIVDKLESGELSLEDSLKEFEAGIKLSRFCAKILDDTEEKIEMIIENEVGDLEIKPYNSSGKE
ncbi:exodeoxyribonuclease VII small subunit [Fuchsiella alkaliacetigena]|uniref:exodeoxyribonuclease VII small subunit n=1 Tax=Fuchsiella alkaliacetigena TaxID=957042 RepID=UPI00200B12E4|nr:exodeoxyribonuclease VII small subunit [Fuchsiella alkaliacetigena]MCK8825443.1 exodeoxyribonuclease VII small subunit [Fuchsiella alkaliacetigena]